MTDPKPTPSETKTEATTTGTRYVCVHCGHRFASEETPDRCPACMRKGGLEVFAKASSAQTRPKWLMPALGLLAVGLVAGAYTLWSRKAPAAVEGEAPVAPLSLSDLRGYLRLSNADVPLRELFEANDDVESLAAHATGSSNRDKAASLTAWFGTRRSAGAFSTWSLDTPRATPMRIASTVAGQLAQTDHQNLYPLEIAATAVAALRHAEVPAMIAEVWEFPNDRTPPDPGGRHGYFAVAVWDGEVGRGDPHIYDPYGGHEATALTDKMRVLTDVQAVGAALGTEALHLLVNENQPPRAMQSIERALALDPRAPYLRGTHAALLIASGGLEPGIEELRAAAQLRQDAPRRNNLAGVFLATGDLEGARREIATALEQFPNYGAGHATLAALLMAEGDAARSDEELRTAERLSPDLLMLPMLFAESALRKGDNAEANRRAAQAIERRPLDWQTHLNAGRVFRATSDFDSMRRAARKVMELVDDTQQEAMRAQVLSLLGPTALEEEEDPLAEEEGEDEGDSEESFELESDLLNDEPAPRRQGGGPALMLGEPSDYDLGGGNLQLDLTE